MEDEGIEAVLAKAIDLRLKIGNCIHIATTANISNNIKNQSFEEEKQESDGLEEKGEKKWSPKNSEFLDGVLLSEAEEGEDDEIERLFHICDALESLENQLSNLQALQQRQHYEKEVALGEIEHSRKILLDKLKDYKGEDLEVIKEASAFAGETVEPDNDLLLPPYPSRLPQSLVLNNRHLSPFHSTQKSNGIITGEAKRYQDESESNQVQTASNSRKGLGHIISAAAKTVITLVGVISVLSLAGFGPGIGKNSVPLKVLGLCRQQPVADERKQDAQCPPGRILVWEDGEARCVVKERVAVPFTSVVGKQPDVNYGSG